MKLKKFFTAAAAAAALVFNDYGAAYMAGDNMEKVPASMEVSHGNMFEIAKLGTNGQLLEEYRLSKYDVINILVIGFPDGIGVNDITIGPDGYVQLPYVGTAKLSGLTLSEAREYLKEKLGEFLRIPDMSVVIKNYGPKKVYVMGEVNNPGVCEMAIDQMNVYAAVSSAGGIATHGRPKHVQVIRVIDGIMYYKEVNIESYIKKHDMDQNIVLKDGDIVYVPRSNKLDLKEDILPYISLYGVYKSLTD